MQTCDAALALAPGLCCAWSTLSLPPKVFPHQLLLWHHRRRATARAVRLGYNVMVLDTDMVVYEDPYKYIKSGPLKDVHLFTAVSGVTSLQPSITLIAFLEVLMMHGNWNRKIPRPTVQVCVQFYALTASVCPLSTVWSETLLVVKYQDIAHVVHMIAASPLLWCWLFTQAETWDYSTNALLNLGFLYIQNASPAGPAAQVVAEVPDRQLRYAEDGAATLASNWGMVSSCGTDEQLVFDDVVYG